MWWHPWLRAERRHSDYKMTLRYSHPSPSHLRGAVDRLDGLTTAHKWVQSAVESVEQPVSP